MSTRVYIMPIFMQNIYIHLSSSYVTYILGRRSCWFIDMHASKKARQQVKNTYDGSRKSRTGNRGRRVYTL